MNAFFWEKINDSFSKLVSQNIGNIIFDQLSFTENKKNKVIIINVDSLSKYFLEENDGRLYKLLIDVIKNCNYISRDWNEWSFILSDKKLNAKDLEQIDHNNNKYSETNLVPFYTFNNYFSKNDNFEVVKTCSGLVKQIACGKTTANSLFIDGSSGYGITYIIQAMGNELFNNNHNIKLLFCTGEEFVNDYTNSFTSNQNNINFFNKKYRNLDVLLLDDFQFLDGKDASLKTFFSILNEMLAHQKLIVLTSDMPLNQLVMKENIISRIKSGLMIKINIPDFETRMEIFEFYKKKEILIDLTIDKEAQELICQSFKNPRELIGAITNLSNRATIYNEKTITLEMVNKFIKDTVQNSKLNYNDIINIVCNYFNTDQKNVLKKGTRDINKIAGDFIIYFLHEKLNYNQRKIANMFNLKEHSSISKRIKNFENIKNEYKEAYRMINLKINSEIEAD